MKTLTLSNKYHSFLFSFFLATFFLVGFFFLTEKVNAQSQNTLSLSVSPIIYDVSVVKEQELKSNLRVINVNKKDLTVFLQVVNFIPSDDKGSVKFLPPLEDEDKNTLANWINITNEPLIVPAEQVIEVPFSLNIPQNAPPGGHYAAILVSTRPFFGTNDESNLKISQVVTSLVFAKVAGTVNELGFIRDFYTTHNLVEKPEVSFELRFENTGNVYLQPQGEIKIFNMWGEERGVIPVNQTVGYGKVPQKQKTVNDEFDGIRKFSFSWKGEGTIFDIGRYKAVATLSFGSENKHTTTAETTFWVFPLKFVFISIVSFIIIVLIISWIIKIYIRRVLQRAGLRIDNQNFFVSKKQKLNNSDIDLSGKNEVVSLKQTLNDKSNLKITLAEIIEFYLKHKKILFFGFVFFLIIFCLIFFIKEAKVKNRSFEIFSTDPGQNIHLSSEDIIYNQLRAEDKTEIKIDKNLPSVEIINRSGVPGEGAKLKLKLEEKGFAVANLSADFSSEYKKTVIIYNQNYQTIASDLSLDLGNALLSANSSSEAVGIKIIIGGNFTDFSL